MIFELFNSLLKEICIHQPDDPICWLSKRLKQRIPHKVILIGPPGGLKKEFSTVISKELNLANINSGSLIYAEVDEDTDYGKMINDSGFNEIDLVDDNLVTKLVLNKISDYSGYIDINNTKNTNKGYIL